MWLAPYDDLTAYLGIGDFSDGRLLTLPLLARGFLVAFQTFCEIENLRCGLALLVALLSLVSPALEEDDLSLRSLVCFVESWLLEEEMLWWGAALSALNRLSLEVGLFLRVSCLCLLERSPSDREARSPPKERDSSLIESEMELFNLGRGLAFVLIRFWRRLNSRLVNSSEVFCGVNGDSILQSGPATVDKVVLIVWRKWTNCLVAASYARRLNSACEKETVVDH